MLIYTDGQFFNGPEPEGDAKAAVRAEIERAAAAMRAKFCAPTSPYEAASWPLKLAEARTYAASGDAADAPILSAEAAARGCTLPELLARVNSNAASLAALEAQIAGVSGRHRDALAGMTDEEALAYDWRDGWPE